MNRIIRRTEAGWETEADMRHGELLVQQLGSSTARKITTPVADSRKHSNRTDVEMMELEEKLDDPSEITYFRSQGART